MLACGHLYLPYGWCGAVGCSMGNADEEGLAAIALEAARLTGLRMIIQVSRLSC